MGNIFQMWNFMERVRQRCVCFKGSSGGVKETEAQRASSEIALKNYNDYMETIRPVEDQFIADVTADPASREKAVAGQITADVAQKVGTPVIDPNKGMAPGATAAVGNVLADAQVRGKQNVDAQRLTGEQAIVDMGMGKATTAQTGMSGLASQSVAGAVATQKNELESYNSTMAAGASGLGMAAGITKNLYDDSKAKG